MTHKSAETRGIKAALLAYSLLFVLQITAYFKTNLLTLMAQALEVLSDVLVCSFLLISIFWSRRPPDELHMLGHGRSQNVAALVSATIFIAFMSVEVLREAVPKLLQEPESHSTQDPSLALLVIIVSMIVLIIPIIDIVRIKTRGASIKTQLVQLSKDEISYVPALIGVMLVSGGFYLADAVTSVIIAAIIAVGGIYHFRDNVHYLVGRAPDRAFMERLERPTRAVPGVPGVHDLKAEYVGPGVVQAGFHTDVRRGTLIEEADRIAHEVEQRVKTGTGCTTASSTLIRSTRDWYTRDPATESHCPKCQLE